MNMLAHSKIQAGVNTQFGHLPQPQNKSMYEYIKSTRNIHCGKEVASQDGNYKGYPQCHRQSDIDRSQLEQRQQHKYYHDIDRNHNQRYRDQAYQQPRHSRSMGTIRSTTIYPTIANMVSPTSPRSASLSPPPSFRHSFSFSCPPSTSPRLGNAPISPEWKSEGLDRYHYHRSHSPHSPKSPSPTRDVASAGEAMEMDQGFALEELDSDSLMDQCEPQSSWSSSSQLTNSPSPIMSSTPYQLPSVKRESSFTSSTSSNRFFQQDLPPPQQQHLRDYNPGSRSSYSFIRSSHEHHPMNGSSHTTNSLLDSSDIIRRSPGSEASRLYRPRPYSFPIGSSSVQREQPSVRSLSLDRNNAEHTSTLVRPRTPPCLNSNPSLRYDGKKRERDTEQERDLQKRSFVSTIPKANEHISEAQKILYERHPPSPQYGQSSTSSSTPSSPLQDSPKHISSARIDQRISFESSGDELSQQLPPIHSMRDAIDYNSSRKLSSEQQQRSNASSMELVVSRRSYSETDGCASLLRRSISSAPRSSPSLLPSPLTGGSTPIQTNLPGTEGMTVIKNEDGAIAVYNPITDAMSFRCELCPNESFGRIHDLKRHQTSKHQEMTWPCDFCHRPFVRRDALLRHYTVKAARDDGLHPASHEVEKLLAARARAKMLHC